MIKFRDTLARECFFRPMLSQIFVGISLLSSIFNATPAAMPAENVVAQKTFSMENRYPDKWVSGIFSDNILLTLAYLRGYEKTSSVNWEAVRKPFHYEFKLDQNQVFAFHDDVLPQFKNEVVKTMNAHFSSYEGYESDGWLVGDGVCHLASFINMVAREAGLDVVSPTNHDFAAINEVPRQYGVAIYDVPGQGYSNEMQNLYIKNNKDKAIEIAFDYDGRDLKVSVEEAK